ncbi:hypothetical protein [Nitrincola alkalilacustris]|uniref:hypothetical protein n=1 Tax=Nitrincola alkalilacustris TaxID=1571224 RepID=UPI00124E6EDF|nr:hypothetical protein [Nitrincola alkalilacustris]
MNFARCVTAFAAVLTLVFISLFVWGWFQVKLTSAPEPWLPAPESLSAVMVSPPEGEVRAGEEVLARPLFWAGRRPYVAPDAPQVVQAGSAGVDVLDKTRLLGAYVAQGAAGVILDVDGSRERIQVGDELGGWVLLYTNPMGAVFGKGQQQDGPGTTRIMTLEHVYPAASVRKQEVSSDQGTLEPEEIQSSEGIEEG